MTGIEPFLLGAAATGGSAATVATTGLLGAGGSLTLGSVLSTGLSLATAASSLFSGFGQAGALQQQAGQEAKALSLSAQEDELSAKQEETRGKQQSNDIMNQLLQTIGSQRLAFASNGVDVNFGTPENVAAQTRKIAGIQLGVTRTDAQISALARRRQASARIEEGLNLRNTGKQKAGAAVMGGLGDAGGAINDLVSRRINRG